MSAGVLSACLTTILMLAAYRLYLQLLGPERFGLWMILSSVLTFAQLSNLGLGQALSKQVSSEHVAGDDTAIRSCASTALVTLLFVGSIFFLLIFLLRTPIVGLFRLSASNTLTVLSLLPAMGVLSLYAIYLDALSSILSGLGRMDIYTYLQLLTQATSVGITLLFLKQKWGLTSFVIGSGISYLVLHAATSGTLSRLLPYRVFTLRAFSWTTLRKMLGMSLFLSASSLLSILVGPLNKLLLSRFVGVSALPFYDIVTNGSLKARSLIESAVRPIMPEVSRLAKHRHYVQIVQLNKRLTKILMVSGGLLFISIIVMSGLLVQLWLGPATAGFPLLGLKIVLAASFISLLGVPAYYTLLGLGRSSRLFAANVLQSCSSFAIIVVITSLRLPLSLLTVLISVAMGLTFANIYLLFESKRAVRALLTP